MILRATQTLSGARSRLRLSLATAILACALVAATPIVGSATAVVSKLSFSPSPIGTISSVPPGGHVSVTLTAEDNIGNPIPGATVYLEFKQAPSGGSAFVGTKALTHKAQAFVTDASGHVAITYGSAASYPSSGCDVIHAQDGKTRATSTVVADDAFCFSPITVLSFAPKPIARKGSLGANSHVTVTLTVFGSGGSPLANGIVWVAFKKALNGGSATVNGTSLSGIAVQETTNSSGQVVIIYSTPSVLPTIGADRLVASNAAKFGTVTASDSYRY